MPVRTSTEDVQRPLVKLKPILFRQTPKETSRAIWEAFVDEWGTECWYCGTERLRDRRDLHLDHVEPNKRDGTNDDCWNRALSCPSCNSDKGDGLTPEETMQEALGAGRLATPALLVEQMNRFETRMAWARTRWKNLT